MEAEESENSGRYAKVTITWTAGALIGDSQAGR